MRKIAETLMDIGSPTRARTWDLRINSPSLYQLSYRGIGEVHILIAWDKLVNAYGRSISLLTELRRH
jgi:hypothetical protein